jgi:putative protease
VNQDSLSIEQEQTTALAVMNRRKSAAARPELLAPAGDWDCAKAAVENGADAIYFGLDRFNARMRAQNFTESDLPKLMAFLHRRGVKGYVTLNTLVFQNEVDEARRYLRTMIAAGVDAVIVQDVGICRLIRELSPDFPIHASTQMTITSAQGVRFAQGLGCSLVVLARECSVKEIERIQAYLHAISSDSSAHTAETGHGHAGNGPSPAPFPLEVFVHGALCVAYSGQCLTSESLGGRSANRGECAQACRMPYELISDGQKVPLGDRRYLLSPQDLAGLAVLPDLVRLGVSSLKIEGRLKSPEYVANITRVYQQALDRLSAGTEPSIAELVSTSRYELEMAFSRGLYTGWFGGTNNQELVHGRFGKKRGVYLGEIGRVLHDQVLLKLEGPLKAGDGVVFDSGQPEDPEEGGRVYSLQRRGAETLLGFGTGDIDFQRIHPGDKLWKTSDPELERRVRKSYAGETPVFRRPVDLEVHGKIGEPLTVIARDELGHIVRVDSSITLCKAQELPLTTERLTQQLGRLGGTPFVLGRLENRLGAQCILPLSELNRLRRAWVSELEQLRTRPKRWILHEQSTTVRPLKPATDQSAAELMVLVRDAAQLQGALDCGIRTLYCEFEDPKRYREAVQRFREQRQASSVPEGGDGSAIFVAPPRIFKMGEDWVLRQVRSCEADGYLVRNYDHLKYFAGCRCIGDYSLNVANALAADYFKNRFGLERIAPSYDLNFTQLEALLQAAPPEWFEVTVHQHMPMFHMEHCVFCAFLSKGTDYTNCGRPCDRHQVELEDRVGARHPVKADAGCRNTVFNALAQTGAEHLSRMRQLGVRHFRIEFLNESPELVSRTLREYQKLLAGHITGTALWRELRLLHQLGVTRGQVDARR